MWENRFRHTLFGVCAGKWYSTYVFFFTDLVEVDWSDYRTIFDQMEHATEVTDNEVRHFDGCD